MALEKKEEKQLFPSEKNYLDSEKFDNSLINNETSHPESNLLSNKVRGNNMTADLNRKMPGLERIRQSARHTSPPEKLTIGKILLITSGLFIILCSISSFIYTPFDFMMKERTRMTPGLPAFDWWKNPPDEVLLKAYVFNVTNSKEFISGKDTKLKMEEVGPFVFLEKLEHNNVKFNGNGTLTYTANRTAVFLPELSKNCSLDMRLIVPNLALLAGASFLSEFSFVAKLGFNILARRLNSSAFAELTVNEYFWNWTDPLVGVARKLMPHVVPVSNIGVLDMIYSNFVDEVTVYIGASNERRFFLIDKFHGTSRLGYWPGEKCDSAVNSTEGVTYPQYLTKNDTIKYLRKTICRVADLHYKSELIQKSMKAYRYELADDIFHRPKDPKDDCYTLPGDKPLPSGLADISPCYFNFPFGISLPHFFGGTEELMKKVIAEGLEPDRKKHGSYVIIEPTTGVPMESRARSQCNLVMKSLGGFPDFVQKFSDSVVPLFWLEYGQVDLPWYIAFLIYGTTVVLPATQLWLSLFFLILGTALVYYGFSSHFHYIYRRLKYRYQKLEKMSIEYFK